MKTFAALLMVTASVLCVTTGVWAVEYTGSALRDPFNARSAASQSVTEQKTAAEFKLQGIVWNTPKPRAIVNGSMVKIGSIVDGAEVVRIERDGVTLRSQGREFILGQKGKENR